MLALAASFTAVLAFGCSANRVRYASISSLAPAAGTPSAVLYLVGDAGEANAARDAVLAGLSADIDSVARAGQGPPVLVVFLGDNIYVEGAPERPSEDDLRKLSGQVQAIPRLPNVRAVFVPGNHDWGNGGPHDEGLAAVQRQRDWAASMADGRSIGFLPSDGCAGPAAEALGEAARLVFLDTEWLLRERADPRCGSPAEAYARLADTLRASGSRPTVVVAHHPLVTGGPHGGNVSVLEWPPVAYYLAAKSGSIRQDLGSRAYTAMRREIAAAIEASDASPLVYASGHEHTLQVIRMGGADAPAYQIVSGSASRTSSVARVEGTRYASSSHGYVRLELREPGARVVVFALPDGSDGPDARAADGAPDVATGVRAVFACTLTSAALASECAEAPLEAVP